jgi:hypothetical protein
MSALKFPAREARPLSAVTGLQPALARSVLTSASTWASADASPDGAFRLGAAAGGFGFVVAVFEGDAVLGEVAVPPEPDCEEELEDLLGDAVFDGVEDGFDEDREGEAEGESERSALRLAEEGARSALPSAPPCVWSPEGESAARTLSAPSPPPSE